MSRPLRIEYPGAWYHVMNRGRRSEKIFLGRSDYQLFIDLLKESIELWGLKISAFCLMPNHYHLLVQTPEGNLSRVMRHINGVYTQRYNRANKCDGQLFRGRFKSILVGEESYLLELVRYIHRNPVRAKIVRDLDEYPWSSHKGYISKLQKWSWLHKEFIFSILSLDRQKGIVKYLNFVQLGDSREIRDIFKSSRLPCLLGSNDFINWVKERFFVKKENKEVPESVNLAPDVERIKDVVCKYYDTGKGELHKCKRGYFNEPRNVAIYLARQLRRDTLDRIGKEFSLQRYSSVSSVLYKMKGLIRKDSCIQKRVEEIKNDILKGQT